MELASEGQVEQLNALLDLVKLDEKTVTKWKDAAGVDTWGMMDINTIQKCIAFLEKKLKKLEKVGV